MFFANLIYLLYKHEYYADDSPRLCYHIDDFAVDALTRYYSEALKDGDDVLDICSSWVSQ